ncbi:hypothetical protein PtB15_12B402, partial [Puccinia triticina]
MAQPNPMAPQPNPMVQPNPMPHPNGLAQPNSMAQPLLMSQATPVLQPLGGQRSWDEFQG